MTNKLRIEPIVSCDFCLVNGFIIQKFLWMSRISILTPISLPTWSSIGIGQTKDVKVFRLVTRGTFEELRYLRQVYKTQLNSETIVNLKDTARAKPKRTFRGVAGDTSRKGELFGLENLLKFHDGNFFNYGANVSESKQLGVDVHGTDDLLEQVQDMDEEELDAIGDAENVFEDLARGTRTTGGIFFIWFRWRWFAHLLSHYSVVDFFSFSVLFQY